MAGKFTFFVNYDKLRRNNLEVSIIKPEKHLQCYRFQCFANGPYQGGASGHYQEDHSFQFTRAAVATRSHA